MKEPFIKKTESTLQLTNWQELNPRLLAGFTTKHGGKSNGDFQSNNLGLHVQDIPENVNLNRASLAENLGFPTNSWACAEQTHEDHIVKITPELTGYGAMDYNESIKGTDGFYTKENNTLLTLCYADCVPLFYYAPDHSLIGVAHAGWKGTVKNIAGKMIQLWELTEKVSPSEIQVAIGPSIDGCCYIVDELVIQQVKEALPHYSPTDKLYMEKVAGQFALNLKEVNKQLLIQAGVSEDNILTSTLCTSCEDKLFFSHRRDKGSTGRMLSFIGFKRRD